LRRGLILGKYFSVIASDQSLTISGALQGTGSNIKTYRVLITSWHSILNGNGDRLASTFSMEFRQDGVTGLGTVTAASPGIALTRLLP
jgi:hypothetical protein